MPSSTICVASWKSAYCRRLSTKPVESVMRAVSLPVAATISSAIAVARSSVPACGISSTPGMNGAGFEKCTPRNRSGFVTASASEPMRIVEVLDPMTASGRAAAEIRRRVACLISSFSGTASSMKSASATASSMDAAGVTAARIRSTASAGNSPSATNLAASSSSRAWFATAISSEMSAMRTSAREREHLRDSAAHVPGSDDGDAACGAVLVGHGASPSASRVCGSSVRM